MQNFPVLGLGLEGFSSPSAPEYHALVTIPALTPLTSSRIKSPSRGGGSQTGAVTNEVGPVALPLQNQRHRNS